jgi:hypothetical protein
VTDEQKVRFAALQLLGSASAWWDTFNAMQQVDHQVTWQEFTVAFREYFIPMGVLNRKLSEFLDLKQGSLSVMEYANKFNHLAWYGGTHIDTNEKKRDCFYRGLSCILQKELYTGNYKTFGTLMNAAIAMEGLQRDTQVEWKHKRGISRSSSHPQVQKMQVVKRMSYHSPGGQLSRQPQQTHHTQSTQYRAPTQQVQRPQGQQFPPRQGQVVKSTSCFKCGKEGHFAR